MINLEDLGLGTLDTGATEVKIAEASAFQRLGKFYDVPKNQRIVVAGIKDMVSAAVPEGGLKPIGGALDAYKLYSDKFASIVVQSDEIASNASRITDIIWNEFPSKHAEQFDRYVAGIDAIPADVELVNLGATTNLQSIRTGADAQADFDDATAKVVKGDANGIVLSSTMYSYMRRQRIAATGQRAFDIEGDNKAGTIDGINYSVFKSTTLVGFVGDFDRFAYTLHNEMVNKIWDQASLFDETTDTEYRLAQKNLIGLVSEVWQGAAVSSVNDFVKITAAA